METFRDENAIAKAERYRRQKSTSVLTILITDIASSTALREELGELVYEEVREAHDRLVLELFESEGAGMVLKHTGDGFLAVFSEPSTAVARALRLQKEMRKHRRFALRVGIDLGQVSLESRGGIVSDVFGRHVNRTARLQALAAPGHVLTSFQVYDCAVGWLKDGSVAWHNHGPIPMKGFAEPVSVHEPHDPATVSPQTFPATSRATLLRARGAPVTASETSFPDPQGATVYSSQIRPMVVPGTGNPLDRCLEAIAISVKQLTRQPWAREGVRLLWLEEASGCFGGVPELLARTGLQIDRKTTMPETPFKPRTGRYAAVVCSLGLSGQPDPLPAWLPALIASKEAIPVIVVGSLGETAERAAALVKAGAFLCTAGIVTLLDGIHQALGRETPS